jgi:hypothetical protein
VIGSRLTARERIDSTEAMLTKRPIIATSAKSFTGEAP